MTELIIRYAVPSGIADKTVIPSEVVGELVRCKDCEYNHKTDEDEYNHEDIVCDYWLSDGLMDDDFCSYGKRKGGAE